MASGYKDRAKEDRKGRIEDLTERIYALQESLEKSEIDQVTFDRLRDEIAGGDLESTHLVKGLDFKLLARIRRGEDISGEATAKHHEENEVGDNVDGEFEALERQEVQAKTREASQKKGQLSTVSLNPGKKRTRDQILAELKASRQAAAQQQGPALGKGFSKIGTKKTPGAHIERDSKGREVLIIIDEDGHEKRKIRKTQTGKEAETASNEDLLLLAKRAKPLGMDVPAKYRDQPQREDDAEVDIFEGVGDDYDPLAGIDDSDSEEEEERDQSEEDSPRREDDMEGGTADGPSAETSVAPPKAPAGTARRDYFKGSKTGLVSAEEVKAPSMSDPAIMAAVKRAAALKPMQGDEEGEEAEKAREAGRRRKKMMEDMNRDDDDIDMGFGTSRFADDDEWEEQKVKLSVWGEDGDAGEERGRGRARGGKGPRRRGPKKRRGDGNSAADVLRVMEQRKKS